MHIRLRPNNINSRRTVLQQTAERATTSRWNSGRVEDRNTPITTDFRISSFVLQRSITVRVYELYNILTRPARFVEIRKTIPMYTATQLDNSFLPKLH